MANYLRLQIIKYSEVFNSLVKTYICNKVHRRWYASKTLQKILGHSTLAITMDRYVHVVEDEQQKEMENIQSYLKSRWINWCSNWCKRDFELLKSPVNIMLLQKTVQSL